MSYKQVTFRCVDKSGVLDPIEETFHLDELGWLPGQSIAATNRFCEAALERWISINELDVLDRDLYKITYFLE
ncbi:hypothetical protein [Domibacillus aminovorans]|uniref:Uncharacterized protein n=1 Tax=Domibacillus aminovorans TaxID=29332 RepID=A0A177L4Z1_9BACI|nr:hypothetical protein [Domibacillus aminovorans]OAH60377.1 hypothetical protein AWH49_16755 [Domibacillus aminovorans]